MEANTKDFALSETLQSSSESSFTSPSLRYSQLHRLTPHRTQSNDKNWKRRFVLSLWDISEGGKAVFWMAKIQERFKKTFFLKVNNC